MRVETFHTPGDLRLEVSVPAGSISIRTVDGEETRVEVESVDGDESIEAATIIDANEGRVLVAMQEERRFLFIKTIPGIRVRITCPHDAKLMVETVSADLDAADARFSAAELKSVSGDMRLERIGDRLRMKSVSGDLNVDDVGGQAVAQTVSGDVFVGHVAGDLEFRTISGDARVDDAESSVTGQTVSGDLRLGRVAQGKVTLKTVSGDMLVGIRSGSALWVDAKSVSGDTSSELALGEAPTNGDERMVELRATAMSGDIRVVRA